MCLFCTGYDYFLYVHPNVIRDFQFDVFKSGGFYFTKKKYKYRQVFFSIIIGQYDFFTLMNQEKQLGLTVQVTLNIFYSIHYRLIL